MRQTPRNTWWLFFGLISLSSLGWIVNTFSPKTFPILILFFLLIGCTATSLSLYALNNVRRALLIGIGVAGFLLLRFLGLREWFYGILLLASLASLEVFFQKR